MVTHVFIEMDEQLKYSFDLLLAILYGKIFINSDGEFLKLNVKLFLKSIFGLVLILFMFDCVRLRTSYRK